MNEEDYQRLIREAKKDKRKFKGYTPEAREVDGKIVTALVPNTAGTKPGVDWGKTEHTQDVAWNLDQLAKRTDRQRVDSLAARLWQAVERRQPGELELILKELQSESWKAGSPITYDDIRKVAVEQMRLAAERLKEQESHQSTRSR